MALLTFVNAEAKSTNDNKKPKKKPPPQPEPSKRRKKQEKRHQAATKNDKPSSSSSSSSSSSWDQFKNLLTCKQIDQPSRVHDPSASKNGVAQGYSKLGSSCSSICSFRDVVHGNTRVVHRADNSPENSSVGQDSGLLSRKPVNGSTTRSARSNGGGAYTSSSTSRAMQFRKLSGCYECHMIVDPSRYPITPRSTICACPQCGEVFPKIESLELHQAIRHAVSELGPEDSGRNIVEIIFKSSWLKKDSPIFKIERILKVHNTQRTIQRFEDCRDAVKSRHAHAHAHGGARKNPRCAADGNELLRFHCTTLACSLGARGSTSLCSAASACGVCAVIRHGFQRGGAEGVWTSASSGRAHDSLTRADQNQHDHGRRAMIVCRVIAGRVRRAAAAPDDAEDETVGLGAVSAYDSVAGCTGVYANLEELVVFNPRAILPCFVVIYKALESQ